MELVKVDRCQDARDLLATAVNHERIAAWRETREGASSSFVVIDNEGRSGAALDAGEVVRLFE